MSRYAFYEVVVNVDDLIDDEEKYDEDGNEIDNAPIDTKGYSLQSWIDYGIVGWDGPLETYFIQLDTGGDVPPPWWVGTYPREIDTFEKLCEKINEIFGANNGLLKFENVIEIDN